MLTDKDLWIGDLLQLKKSGKKGKYAGKTKDGKARVQLPNKIILTPYSNLVLLTEEKFEDTIFDEIALEFESKSHDKKEEILESTIDLHMEVLAPDHLTMSPHRIMDFQLTHCKIFIEKCIAGKKNHIVIIHGKGEGILKEGVLDLLQNYQEVNFIVPSRSFGSVEVWLNYL